MTGSTRIGETRADKQREKQTKPDNNQDGMGLPANRGHVVELPDG